MHRALRLPAAAILTIGLVAAASAQQPPAPADKASGGSSADKAMMSGMQKMQQDMAAAPMTGDADKDFVAMMIPHHQGAVSMAQVELQYGKDKQMRALAKSIIAAQRKEIAEMKAWQTKHAAK